MESNRHSGADLWRKARVKTVLTKRYAFHKMDKIWNDADVETIINNDFISCFFDETESEDDADDIELEEDTSCKIKGKELSGAQLNDSQLSLDLNHKENGANDHSGSGVKGKESLVLLSSHDPVSSVNDFVDASAARSRSLISKHADQNDKDLSNNEEGLDFVDMALERRDNEISDSADQGLGRGDAQFHSRKKAKKYPAVQQRISKSKSKKFQATVTFGWLDMVIGVAAIILFFVDIGTDIELAVHYFEQEMWIYGGVTTGLIVGPSMVTCFLGLQWYIIDYRKERSVVEKLTRARRKAYVTPGHAWFLRFFFTLLQVGPVLRIIEFLYCGRMSVNKKLSERLRRRYYRFMLYEDVDSCLLRLFESFLEAAPQLTWQLYIGIVLKPQEDVVGTSFRVIALLSSWASLAVSLVSYHKSLRNSHEEKAKMTLTSLPFYFIWRASEIGGRVLCIAMFASAFELWVFGPIAFHWVFISGWLMMQKTTFYKNNCLEKVFNVICGYVMIFCFLNLREGRTRFRFLMFYVIVYVQNFFMLGLWFRFSPDLGAWFHIWGFIVVLILFIFHVIFQLIYYAYFHPTKSIDLCLPCDPYIIYSSICYDVRPGRDDVMGEASERYNVSEIAMDGAGSLSHGNRHKKECVTML